jgi:hypothetical protein
MNLSTSNSLFVRLEKCLIDSQNWKRPYKSDSKVGNRAVPSWGLIGWSSVPYKIEELN